MENKEIPQWQINMLDRFPRPVALVLIASRLWFMDIGLPILIAAAWCLLIPAVFTAATQTGLMGFTGSFAVMVLTGVVLIKITFSIMDRYDVLKKQLPVREKKPDESKEVDVPRL